MPSAGPRLVVGDDWPFDQGPDVAAIRVRSVLVDGRSADEDQARLISMAEAVAVDPSVLEVAGLPPGFVAWRKAVDRPWMRGRRG